VAQKRQKVVAFFNRRNTSKNKRKANLGSLKVRIFWPRQLKISLWKAAGKPDAINLSAEIKILD